MLELVEKLDKISYIESLQDVSREDKSILIEYMLDESAILMEMANVVGNLVKTDKIPFSFYFSSKKAVYQLHGIRIKIIWNPSKTPDNADGYLKLHGNYDYVVGSHKYKPTEKELKIARDFAKKYKILFAAVWECKLDPSYLQEFFRGNLILRELLINFENVSEKEFYLINHCKSLLELEDCVRKNKIFNMND